MYTYPYNPQHSMKVFTSILLFLLSTPLLFGQLEEKIDSLFTEYADVPGCAIGVYSKGEVLLKKGYGIANLDYDIEISPETVFDIGSVSKQFTAACIVLLENEGKLSLDDDIRTYIPELPEYAEGTISIRNLLHHTSGLRDYLTLMYLSGISFDDHFTEEKGLGILTRQKELNFEPGSEFLYSNSGYLVLAIIIRRVSGESIGAFAQKHLFDPLGMQHTFIYEDGTQVVKNRAIGYTREGETYKREHHFDFEVGGDGQVYTTVEDFFKWSEAFKANTLGNPTFWDQMLTKGVLSNGDTINYALGLSHGKYNSYKTISHGGAWGAFRAYYFQFPEEDLAIALMSNYSGFNPGLKARQVANLLLPGIEKKEQEAKAEKEAPIVEAATEKFPLDQLVGTYEIEPGANLEITIRSDSLFFTQNWNEASYTVTRVEGSTFQIPGRDGIRFIFTQLKEGFTQKLTIRQGENETVCNRREEIDSSSIDLAEYSADYYSEELDVTYRVTLEEDGLQVVVKNNQPIVLDIYDTDTFTCEFGTLRFIRKNQRIDGFEMDAGRVTNLTFERQ